MSLCHWQCVPCLGSSPALPWLQPWSFAPTLEQQTGGIYTSLTFFQLHFDKEIEQFSHWIKCTYFAIKP